MWHYRPIMKANPQTKTITLSTDLQHVRARICDMMIAASAIFAIPALAASLYRATSIGWLWTMYIHIVGAACIVLLFIFRKSIPYNLRAGPIVGVFLVVGMGGFWQNGMVAGANPMLLISPILASVLFGKRLGISYTVAVVAVMVVTAYTFVFGGRVLHIDTTTNPTFLPAWITYLMTVVLSVAAAVAAISMTNHHLASALFTSRQSQDELEALNRDLEAQVLRRTQELEAAKLGAEQLARTDVLTGLNNRRAFFEYAEVLDGQARRYNHTYVIAIIDIDHFKAVNDCWGHDTGDVALQTVAHRIEDTLRDSDISGRIGGEEFAIILPQTSAEEGSTLVERLRNTIEQTVIDTPKTPIQLTISVGIAALEDKNCSLESVVTNADAALYRAKNNGRNTIEQHVDDVKIPGRV